jgi:hypothetical protein
MMAMQGMLLQDPIPSCLKEYGIQTEDSDYRVHVSFDTRSVFMFPTKAGRRAVEDYESKRIKPVLATDPAVRDGQPTARGFKVFWKHIDECQRIPIPDHIFYKHSCSLHDRTSVKGAAAAQIAMEMVNAGLIRLPMMACEVFDLGAQMRGQDMIVTRGASIQIKCDWFAGHEYPDGSIRGLYLQTHERNPLKQY